MFTIEIKKFYWIKKEDDDPDDLCLHGDVSLIIGNEFFEYSCTVSASALYLLKTLTENHVIHQNNQMLPCCGYFLIPNDTDDTVEISGCSNGIDWTVIHCNGGVELVTEAGNKSYVTIEDYKKIVFDFVDKVQAHYEKCKPKNLPSDDFTKRGYIAFWNEWKRRRLA